MGCRDKRRRESVWFKGEHARAEIAGIVKGESARVKLSDISDEKLEIFVFNADGSKRKMWRSISQQNTERT